MRIAPETPLNHTGNDRIQSEPRTHSHGIWHPPPVDRLLVERAMLRRVRYMAQGEDIQPCTCVVGYVGDDIPVDVAQEVCHSESSIISECIQYLGQGSAEELQARVQKWMTSAAKARDSKNSTARHSTPKNTHNSDEVCCHTFV